MWTHRGPLRVLLSIMAGFVRLIQFDMLSDAQLRAVVADSARPTDDQQLAADILDSRDRPGARFGRRVHRIRDWSPLLYLAGALIFGFVVSALFR